ncbi:hypothetical protein T484DRAFT_1802584, partial [Baffinella frigidus]
LELRKGRKEGETRASIRSLQQQIARISARLDAHPPGQTEAGASGSDAGPMEALARERQDLRTKRAALIADRERLEAKVAADDFLAAEDAEQVAADDFLTAEDVEEVREAEETLEAIDAEMEYKTQAIAELRSLIAASVETGAGGAGAKQRAHSTRLLDEVMAANGSNVSEMPHGEAMSLLSQVMAANGSNVSEMPHGEAMSLLSQCVERVLVLKEVSRQKDRDAAALQKDRDAAALQVRASEAAARAEALQSSLRSAQVAILSEAVI